MCSPDEKHCSLHCESVKSPSTPSTGRQSRTMRSNHRERRVMTEVAYDVKYKIVRHDKQCSIQLHGRDENLGTIVDLDAWKYNDDSCDGLDEHIILMCQSMLFLTLFQSDSNTLTTYVLNWSCLTYPSWLFTGEGKMTKQREKAFKKMGLHTAGYLPKLTKLLGIDDSNEFRIAPERHSVFEDAFKKLVNGEKGGEMIRWNSSNVPSSKTQHPCTEHELL